MTWENKAACRDLPAEWFVGDLQRWEERRAKEVCARCPVVEECVQLADEVESDINYVSSQWTGVWGGETPAERRVRRGHTLYVQESSFRRKVKNVSGVVHGTPKCYQNGCRQFECCEAHRLAVADYRRRKKVGLIQPKGGSYPHGTETRYHKGGCRCPRCTEAYLAKRREYRQLKRVQTMRERRLICRACQQPFYWLPPPRKGGHPRVYCEKCKALPRYQREKMVRERNSTAAVVLSPLPVGSMVSPNAIQDDVLAS